MAETTNLYEFENFQLNTKRAELSKNGVPLAIEPKIYDLLIMFVRNAEALISKDELISTVWQGRIVSDSAVSSSIKVLRQTLGDDGKQQRFIKTVHGKGFRFVAAVNTVGSPTEKDLSTSIQTLPEIERHDILGEASQRPSIAILPLQLIGSAGALETLSDALPHDIITELSRLRWLFIIARGSSFKFRDPDIDVQKVGLALSARYCLSGSMEIVGRNMNVNLELADTRDGGVVWAERYAAAVEEIHNLRSEIVASIVSTLETQITSNEAKLAILKSSDNLDAWSAYHLGLRYMYRFTQDDNQKALHFFKLALAKDPGFARASAGRSFTHFQNAFLNYTGKIQTETALARQFAEQGIDQDPLDPFTNLTMGRAFWLSHNLDQSHSWLQRATNLSPNYAQAVYSLAWTDTLSGRSDEGQSNVDMALRLSPMDPLLYAMLGTRALSYLQQDKTEEAAQWAEKAANSVGAHALIGLIAVIAHSFNDDPENALKWANNIRAKNTKLEKELFFQSFPFADTALQTKMSKALTTYGF